MKEVGHAGCAKCGGGKDEILTSLYTIVKGVLSSFGLCKKCAGEVKR